MTNEQIATIIDALRQYVRIGELNGSTRDRAIALRTEAAETAQRLRAAPRTPAACEQPDIDALAQFIRDAEREHGQCDDDDTYISYRPTARAILQKFDVRPKHSSTVGGPDHG